MKYINIGFLIILLTSCITPSKLSVAQEGISEAGFDPAIQLKTFDEVWRIVKDSHYDEELVGEKWDARKAELRPKVEQAKNVQTVRSILNDLLSGLGQSHCAIIPREEYQLMEQQADRGGPGYSGLSVRFIDERLVITDVRNGSPAEIAGLRPGFAVISIEKSAQKDGDEEKQSRTIPAEDLIYEVRKATKSGVTRFETAIGLAATSMMTGEIGDELRLNVEDHDGQLSHVVIQLIAGPGISTKLGNLPMINVEFRSEILEKNIGYIAFNAFLDPARLITEFQQAITTDFAETDGLIIDMRGNMGGMILLTMGMSSWFVDKPNYLGMMTMKDTPLKVNVNPRRPTYKKPIAVLIDECSISAAEIYAGGLSDMGIARVFGQRTAGLVLPSNVSTLPNGDGLQYVMANYQSASGKVLEGNGVTPDFPVALSRKAFKECSDPTLFSASEWLVSRSKESK